MTHLLKISRLESLTDGIFAIAMTIMALNLHVEPHLHQTSIFNDDIFLNLVIYVGSFIILGTHWIAMNFLWGLLERLNRIYLWINLFYLMIICVIPFSAYLLGEYPRNIQSVNFYAINLLFGTLGQFCLLEFAVYFNLFKKTTFDREIHHAALSRMSVAPIFYMSSLIISHWNIAIAFILLVAPTFIYLIPGKIDQFEANN